VERRFGDFWGTAKLGIIACHVLIHFGIEAFTFSPGEPRRLALLEDSENPQLL
jgi:hypothetical protein